MKKAYILSACLALGALCAFEAGLKVTVQDRLPSFFVKASTRTGLETYGLRPDAAQTDLHQGKSVRVTIDANGHRNTSADATGPTIHLIGDSQVFGWGLSDDETIAARLQAKLGSFIRVENRGLPGAGPFYYLSQLQEIPGSDTAVVVFTETNDLQDTYSPLPIAQERCGFIVVPEGLSQRMPCWLLHSQTYALLIDAVQAAFPDKTPLPLCYNPHLQIACNLANYRATTRLEEMARRRSGATLFLTIPWEAILHSRATARYSPLMDELRYYGRATLPSQAAVLDRLQHLAATAYQQDDHHLSAAGASAVADYILHLICEQKAQNGLFREVEPSLEPACRGT